jgi:TPR repeat protein
MVARVLRRAWCAGSAFALAFTALAAEPASPAKEAALKTARPAHAATAEQVAADPEGVWSRFRAGAELEAAYDAYAVLDTVGSGPGAVDADLCREHAATLRDAVEAVPVSIALHRASLLCADALGDQAGAERETLALAALSKHALRDSGDSPWRRPILVLSPRDIYALLGLLGYEFSYEYYREWFPRRYFPLVVAAWDPEARIERHLSFDYIDAASAIDRSGEYVGYPYHRHALADAFIDGHAKSGESAAIDILGAREAVEQDTQQARVARYRDAVAQGGMTSLVQWVQYCALAPFDGCDAGMVDTLLPQAERKHALPLALLAVLYARGMGVKRDQAKATALLDAADARWADSGASMLFATMQLVMEKDGISEAALQRLRASAGKGPGQGDLLRVLAEMARDLRRDLPADQHAVLTRPSNNGSGVGFATLAEYHDARGETAKAVEARRRAAEHGNAAAQRAEGLRILQEAGDGARARWRPWLVRAAEGGDVPAMRILAAEEREAGRTREAVGWLLAGADQYDEAALLDYAEAIATGEEGLPATPEHAVRILESLADEGEVAVKARRVLARLALEGRGMARDPARARAWLIDDAGRGDADARMALFAFHLDSNSGRVDEAEAMRWADRATAGDAVGAKAIYGAWLVGRSDAARRSRGLAMLRDAVRGANAGQRAGANNQLAWPLCVSRFDDVRDPAAGLAIALALDEDALPPAALDTVAACHAANGNFAEALRLQQRAVDGLPRGADGKPTWGAGIVERLGLYKARKPYIEREGADD